jgi:hypothetical protein
MKLLTLIILFFGHFLSTIKSFYGSGAKASGQSKTKTGRVVFGRKEAQEIALLRNCVFGLKNAEKRIKTA